MGDNKISDDVIRDVFIRNGFTIKEGQDDLKPYVYAAARELISHLQGEAVPVAGLPWASYWLSQGRPDVSHNHEAYELAYEWAKQFHPQPAELNEVSDLMAEAVAVGDGTLHGAITYWHQRALAAEARLSEVSGNSGELEALRKALALAVQQNSHDMLMTGDEIRQCEAALAATGKQQVGEVQGSREQFEAWAKAQGRYILGPAVHRTDRYYWSDTQGAWEAWQAALASRQPGGWGPVASIDPRHLFLMRGKDGTLSSNVLRFGASMQPGDTALYAAPPAQGIDLGPLRILVAAVEEEFCCEGTEANEPDDSKVSYPEETCPITFGMIRAARRAIDGRDAGTGVGNIQPPRDLRTKLGETG